MGERNMRELLASSLTRRRFLASASAFAGLALISQLPASTASAAPRFGGNPFTLGVASGDPRPDSVVIWTRLALDPFNGGGLPSRRIPVRWVLASDDQMRTIVRRGTAVASPELAHSVHVEVAGLEPNRPYWYQFLAGRELSPVGRTRTAAAPGTALDQFRFAFASCQDWQNGFYPAYRAMAEEDLNLVVHLGDYIYEYGPREGAPRQHLGPEVQTLDEYRNLHALYKSDRFLQAAHAAAAWAVTWDDHEVENNYAAAISENPGEDPVQFLRRRAAAYQAYYEHMPLRASALPNGPDMLLYRRLTFGNLAEFSVLDTRQYRSDQPCDDGLKPRCAAALDPAATMTGPEQERWLLAGLGQSQARWNIIAQQTMFAQFDFLAGPGQGGGPSQAFNLDQWDGYVAARNRILGFVQQRQPSNPVIITGDIHSSWVHDIKADFDNPASATLATEFVGTSISSDFPAQFIAPVRAALPDNPHTKFFDGTFRGYVSCTLSPQQWRSDFRVAESILDENAPVRTLASFVVENGSPGAQRV
ncbi:MAG: alkaline phosphatase D family protein [Chloroflexaceae bacterium]|nr:alkaline phosphatase D family protein [Chloroflexaceae bacterium]